MLNYAYGVLHSQVEIALVAHGFDPLRGILHRNQEYAKALVFDFMEIFRPLVDARVLKFVLKHAFSAGDFAINSEGVCRLNPQLAKAVAAIASELDGIVRVVGLIHDELRHGTAENER
jgi:CRISPR/Cas system-associated endonuclease Cas1